MKPKQKTTAKPVHPTTKPATKHTVAQSQSNLKKAEDKKDSKHVKLDSQVKTTHQNQPGKKKSTLSKSSSKEKLTSSKENSKPISKENSSAKLVEKKETKQPEIKKEEPKLANSMFVPQTSQKENLTKTTILTESSYEDVLLNASPDLQSNQIKKLNDEKKELNHIISNLKRENTDLKSKVQELDKLNNELMTEVEESQKGSEQFIKDKNEIEAVSREAKKDLKKAQEKNEELEKKIVELKEDIEILKEEGETKDLEKEILQKNFDDYKKQIEEEKKKQKQEILDDLAKEQKKEGTISLTTPELTAEQHTRITQLEEVINELSSQLKTTSEQRDYAISYYKEQIEKLQSEIQELTKENKIIPEKDDLIRQLTEKIKDDDAIMESLKSQITALSPANDMYEEIIMQKDDLEQKYEELKLENEKLKEDLATDEEMVTDLESTLKISEEMMKKSQNEALAAKNNEEELKKRIAEVEENEKNLVQKISELKKINNLINDEKNSFKKTSHNLEDVLSNSITISNKIKTLQKQKVLINLTDFDIETAKLKIKLINNMIPKKMFEKGGLDNFEKFLTIQNLRKKLYYIMINILENEIINDELAKNPNKNPNESKLEKIEVESFKKLNNFHQNLLKCFNELFSYIYKLEIHLCQLTSDKFLEFTKDEKFIGIYQNIQASLNIVENYISLVRSDNFSINFQTNIDTLKTLNSKIKENFNDLSFNANSAFNYSFSSLFLIIEVAPFYDNERLDIILNNQDKEDKIPVVAKEFHNTFRNLKKNITKIQEKFFDEIPYENANKLFDDKNSNYFKLTEVNNKISEILKNKEEKWFVKYPNILENLNKLFALITSSFEKFENKENENEKDSLSLPLPEWQKITNELNGELENVAQIQESNEKLKADLKNSKIEYTTLKNNFEAIERGKKDIENQLSDLTVKIGRVNQLENEVEEDKKRIEKYKIAVEGLQKSADEHQNKEKEIKKKYDDLKKKYQELEPNKKNTGKLTGKNNLSFLNSDGNLGTFAPIVNTVCVLQKDRKNLKAKLMKEKLNNLISDENSFMNKLIKTNFFISKNPEQKNLYKNIENSVINLNNNYNKIKFSLPKVYDLNDKNYNYNKYQNEYENNLNKLRINYMKDADNILFNMFGNKANDSMFKEMVDNEMEKTLKNYDKNLKIGTIRFKENDNKNKNDNNVNTIPLVMSEDTIKLLNKTFIY